MVAVLKPGVTDDQIQNLCNWFQSRGLDVHISKGHYQTIIGLIGDTKIVDVELLESLDIVEAVKRISEPFKNANRKFHPDDTVIDVKGVKIGGGNFALIAGPCSVESEKQIIDRLTARVTDSRGLFSASYPCSGNGIRTGMCLTS